MMSRGIGTKALWAIAAAVIGIIVVVAAWSLLTPNFTGLYTGTNSADTDIAGITDEERQRHTVPLDQIVSGGPPRDGIPSIDEPKFVSAEEANRFLQDGDQVIGLNINGDIRAYPLQVLVWHEIVNDVVGGTPVAVTYCPLCFTNQVFNRTIDGQVLEFGTSGKLYNSNLVMYDRTSESLWSQALGEGIVGKYAGKKLERIPMDVAFWEDWKKLYPDTKVLSIDTGFERPYGADPYGNYYTSPDLLFPVANKDDRLGLKEIVIGFKHEETTRAYLLEDVETKKVINDEIGGKPIALISLEPFMVRAFDRVIDNQTLDFEYDPATEKIKDKQSGSEWNFEGLAVNGEMKGMRLSRLPFDEGFWFTWIAFHPKTELYSN